MTAGEYIARGWEATVLEWDDGAPPAKVIKLFYESRSENSVRKEWELSRQAQATGVKMPEVFGDVVQLDGRFGIVFERVSGTSMIDVMASKPWKVRSLARSLAELQADLHSKTPMGLPDLKSILARNIQETADLDESQRPQALSMLESLPNGDRLCHGDFHPGNVILRGGDISDPVIIDWGNAALGDPLADLARTQLLITIGWRLLPRRRDRYLARIIVSLFSRWHTAHYLRTSGADASNFSRWRTVLAASRLNEDIPAEREHLLKVLRAGLAQA